MVELTPELIKALSKTRNGFYSWDYVAGLAVWILGVEANNERLQARVQELEQERRWISVEERLPEMYEIVLVVSGGVTAARRKIDIIRGYRWVEIDNIELRGVTHWQHLPQPPKEGE